MLALAIVPTIQTLRIETASIGIPDTLFLMLLALIVFGPRRLPEIGRQIGKLMYEFRKVSNDFKFQMEEELRATEEADRVKKLQQSTALPAPELPGQAVLASSETATSSPAGAQVPGLSDSAGPSPLDAVSSYTSSLPAQNFPEDETFLTPVEGEVRAEPRKFPPSIQPPAGGDPVAAQKPFRGRAPEGEAAPPEPAPEDNPPGTGSADTAVPPSTEARETHHV